MHGERGWAGGQERFLKAKINVEAQAFGYHNFAKGGICKSGTKSLTKINQAPGEKMLVLLFTASLLLCNLLETHQCNYPSLSPGLRVFKSQGWYYLGSNWEKCNLFSCLFYSKTTEWGS